MTSVVLAYGVLFAGVFVFTWTMFSRQRQLNEKLDRLREELRDQRNKSLKK
jgi:CcmD family protein